MDGDALVHIAHDLGDRLALPGGDDLRGGGHDGAGRAVVAGEPHDPGGGIVAAGSGRSRRRRRRESRRSPGRDRRSRKGCRRRRQQGEQPVLLLVDVLEFVDRDPSEAIAVARRDRRRRSGARRARRDRRSRSSCAAPARGHRPTSPRPRRRRRSLRALGLGDRAQQPLGLGLGEAEGLRQQRDALRFARDAEAACKPGRGGVLAQDREAKRMEGVDRDRGALVASRPARRSRISAAARRVNVMARQLSAADAALGDRDGRCDG